MLFFTPLRSVKKSTGLSAPLGKTRASRGPPWPVLSRVLRRRRLIINLLSDAALAPPRPRAPPGRSRPGSPLHNETLCKPAPTPTPTPPRSRAADRPAAPATRPAILGAVVQVTRLSPLHLAPVTDGAKRRPQVRGQRPPPHPYGMLRPDVGGGLPRAVIVAFVV